MSDNTHIYIDKNTNPVSVLIMDSIDPNPIECINKRIEVIKDSELKKLKNKKLIDDIDINDFKLEKSFTKNSVKKNQTTKNYDTEYAAYRYIVDNYPNAKVQNVSIVSHKDTNISKKPINVITVIKMHSSNIALVLERSTKKCYQISMLNEVYNLLRSNAINKEYDLLPKTLYQTDSEVFFNGNYIKIKEKLENEGYKVVNNCGVFIDCLIAEQVNNAHEFINEATTKKSYSKAKIIEDKYYYNPYVNEEEKLIFIHKTKAITGNELNCKDFDSKTKVATDANKFKSILISKGDLTDIDKVSTIINKEYNGYEWINADFSLGIDDNNKFIECETKAVNNKPKKKEKNNNTPNKTDTKLEKEKITDMINIFSVFGEFVKKYGDIETSKLYKAIGQLFL